MVAEGVSKASASAVFKAGGFGGINRTRISRAQVIGNQRALLLCKPDALARGIAFQIMEGVSNKLREKGVAYRIVAPKILQMNLTLARIFYDNVKAEHGQKLFELVSRYASGTHPDPRVLRAPMIAFILEARPEKGEDLIKLLRSDDFIGPTRIDEQILNSDSVRAEQIRKSLRFKFTIGMAVSQRPSKEGPYINCIHCSSSDADAGREISLVYKKSELAPYYQPDALDEICQGLNREAEAARSRIFSIAFEDIANMERHEYKSYVRRILPRFHYDDFDGGKIMSIHGVVTSAMQICSGAGSVQEGF